MKLARAFLVTILAVSACGREPTVPETRAEMFDVFWSTFDREYSYFEYKHIDWDSLRTVFRQRAVAATSEAALVSQVLKPMVAPLRDVHVTFIGADGTTQRSFAQTASVNWNASAWQAFTLKCGLVRPKQTLGYCTDSGIAYVFVGSWNSNFFTTADLDAIIDRFRDAPGMIIDVRSNGGGSDALALALAGRFATGPTTVGYVRFRDGPRHDNFGEEITRRISTRGSFQFLRPVVVLAGRGVYSSSETFVSAMRELPNVTVMGDTTGGGSGNPAQYVLRAWKYTVSRWIEWTADRRIIEWNGIPPDTVVRWDQGEVAAGRDPVIAAALAYLTSR